MAGKEVIDIVGAGPAGLAAAIVLRREGIAVRVSEKSPEVGHRLKGDFQGLENWSCERDILETLKDIGIELSFPCVPYYGGTVYAPEMEPVEVKSERPIFYLVRRGSMTGTLDAGLKEQALALGAEIRFNRRLEGAQGRTIVGTGPRGVDILALGITFETSLPDRAAVAFDNRIAPKGYAYLLVNRGRGTMATVLYREFRRAEEFFARTLRSFEEKIQLDVRNPRKFASFGNFFLRDTQVGDGRLYVGESAGFQDCLWGFGMRYAIISGYLAARSIIDGTHYDALWKRELKPMLETSLVNRYLFERFGHRGYRFLARRFAEGNPCGYLRRHYAPSLLKRILLPLAARSYESRTKDTGFDRKSIPPAFSPGKKRGAPPIAVRSDHEG
jgi:flavin-dependent dehydrogenase